jgi:hypothetical protein
MFDVIGAVEATSGLINGIVDRIWPNPEEADKRRLEQLKAELDYEHKLLVGQLKINEMEAKNQSVFVSGWRPAIGWICGMALLYAALLEPFLRFVARVVLDYDGDFPIIDTDITLQILLGLLGLAGMRSFEKSKKVAR